MESLTPFNLATKLENLSIDLAGPIDIIDMATQLSSENHNSALWLASERIERVSNDLDSLVLELMDLHRAGLKVPKSKRS